MCFGRSSPGQVTCHAFTHVLSDRGDNGSFRDLDQRTRTASHICDELAEGGAHGNMVTSGELWFSGEKNLVGEPIAEADVAP